MMLLSGNDRQRRPSNIATDYTLVIPNLGSEKNLHPLRTTASEEQLPNVNVERLATSVSTRRSQPNNNAKKIHGRIRPLPSTHPRCVSSLFGGRLACHVQL